MLPAWSTRSTVIAGAGTFVVVAGLALYWLAVPEPAGEFGWFAYAPLSNAVYAPQAEVLSAGQNWGTALAALGALLISGVFGYHFGRPSAPEPASSAGPATSGPADSGPASGPVDSGPGPGPVDSA